MAITTVSLAKKIKELVQRHPTLVEADGTQEVPQSFKFDFGGQLEDAGNELKGYLENILDALLANLHTNLTVPAECVSREEIALKNSLFTLRALYSLTHSPRGLRSAKWQTRSMGVSDIADTLNVANDKMAAFLSNNSGVFQFTRIPGDDSAWIFSWILIVDGISISRGNAQPINKFISALLKNLHLTKAVGSKPVQDAVATLAKFKADSTEYYWYLSNQKTKDHYHAFEKYRNITSCMSHQPGYYNSIGPRQHPMDCYNGSPDWRLMMLSDKSPEAIIAMCEAVIANPDHAESLMEYPFLTRCMVLPTSKELTDREFQTPYVFGKFYGLDKMVNYFYHGDETHPYRKNDNPLLSGSYYITGGKIQAIQCTKEGLEGRVLLPYFDKANLAQLVTEDGKQWWYCVSNSEMANKYVNSTAPIAKAIYDGGNAQFLRFYSPFRKRFIDISETTLDTFDTLLGPELDSYRSEYSERPIAGITQLVPNSMLIRTQDGQSLMPTEVVRTFDNRHYALVDVLADTERFVRVDGLGLLDLSVDNHKEAYATLTPTPLPFVEEEVTND